jgi:HSP90 family molecular chaperone
MMQAQADNPEQAAAQLEQMSHN